MDGFDEHLFQHFAGGARKILIQPKDFRYKLINANDFEVFVSFTLPLDCNPEILLCQMFNDHSKKLFANEGVVGPLDLLTSTQVRASLIFLSLKTKLMKGRVHNSL